MTISTGALLARSDASTAPPADSLRVAPVGRRVAAFAVDTALTAAVVAAVYLATGEVLYAVLALIEVPAALIVWEARSGLTIGNAVCRIRTIRSDGPYAPGIRRAVVRSLVVGAGLLVAAVGQWVVVASAAWDRGPLKQGWHDALARTTMVDVAPERGTRRSATGREGGSDLFGNPRRAPQFQDPVVISPEVATGRADLARPDGQRGLPTPTPAPAAAPIPAVAPAPVQPPPAVRAPAPVITPPPVGRRIAAPSSAPGSGAAPVPPGPVSPAMPAMPAMPAWTPPRRALDPSAAAPAPAAGPVAGAQGAAGAPDRAAGAMYVLSFDNGQSFTVRGTGLVGRRPQSQPDEHHDDLLAINDENRSLSKTHLEFGIDGSGFWVTDRGSTNGTSVLTAHGEPLDVRSGMRVHVPADGSVRVGQRQFTASRIAP